MRIHTVLLFAFPLFASAQNMDVTVREAMGEKETKALYEVMDAQRYEADFKMADPTLRYNVVITAREVTKNKTSRRDTIYDSRIWEKKVVGGLRMNPSLGSSFVFKHVDKKHVLVHYELGIYKGNYDVPFVLTEDHLLMDGIRSQGKPVKEEVGKPFPLLVLTRSYPDPPPPAKVVLQRYCFGADVPPEDWPRTFGVPSVIIFEMVLLP